MPTPYPSYESTFTYDEIKGIHHVKDKEKLTFINSNADKRQEKKEKISALRIINANLIADGQFYKTGGKHVVSKIFACRDNEKPLMTKNLEAASMVMDQKVFESQRFLGQLKYDLVKAQEKLAEREAHLADLRSMIRHGFGDLKMKGFLKAQAQVELVRLQNMDAVNTARSYRRVIYGLQKNICDINQAIKSMTICKRRKSALVKEIRKIKRAAVKEFKFVQKKIRPLHVTIDNLTRQYDEELSRKRTVYQEQKRETDSKCTVELKMDIAEQDGPDVRYARDLSHTVKQKALQDVFEEVKEALEISDVKEVLSRVRAERSRYRCLVEQLEDSRHLCGSLQLERDELREELFQLTYNSSSSLSSDAKALEENNLSSEAEKQMQRALLAARRLKKKEEIIAGIKLATVGLHSKLVYVKINEASNGTLIGEPTHDMELIWSKVEKLKSRCRAGSIPGEQHDERKLQKFMERRLPEDNLRCVLRSLDIRSRENLRIDIDDEEASYVSREDIKKRHADILKPKKKKGATQKSDGFGKK